MIIIDDNKLKPFYNLSDDDIKNKTIADLQKLTKDMEKLKAFDETKRNAQDNEYIRLLKKYFTPYNFLRKYWTDEEIIRACSAHISDRNLVEEYKTEHNGCPYPDAEFIKTGTAYMPQYYRGHELAEKKLTKVNIYRVKNQYQGLRHGAVILDLLYSKYPILRLYDFDAYEYREYETAPPYEIYPNNGIYTPFDALMQKDIDAIIKRNMDWSKSYNTETFEKMQKRLNSNEIKEFFETIKNLS